MYSPSMLVAGCRFHFEIWIFRQEKVSVIKRKCAWHFGFYTNLYFCLYISINTLNVALGAHKCLLKLKTQFDLYFRRTVQREINCFSTFFDHLTVTI